MMTFIIFYLLRIITSIYIGFCQADFYEYEEDKSGKFIIFHKKKYFLIWMIPIYGWCWLLADIIKKAFNRLKKIEFFNE